MDPKKIIVTVPVGPNGGRVGTFMLRCPRCRAIAVQESWNGKTFTFRCSSEDCETLFYRDSVNGQPSEKYTDPVKNK